MAKKYADLSIMDARLEGQVAAACPVWDFKCPPSLPASGYGVDGETRRRESGIGHLYKGTRRNCDASCIKTTALLGIWP